MTPYFINSHKIIYSIYYNIEIQIGTYQLAIVAKTFNVPVYVAAESYKFSSNYILGQPKQLTASNRDVTPPQYITLIFSSFIMTPSAVSDELLKRLWKQ